LRFFVVAALGLAGCPGFDSDTDTETDSDTDTDTDTDTGPACVDDTGEENDDAATAFALGTEPFAGQICGGEEDWFALAVPAGCDAQIDLGFTHANGDLDLEVWLGDVRIARSGSTSDAESARFRVEEAATYQVRVLAYGDVENAYSLVATLECPFCVTDDEHEPNDDNSTAVAATFPLSGAGCPADPDWFVLPQSSAGCLVEYRLTSEEDVARAALGLATSTGARFATATVTGDAAVVRAMAPASGRLTVDATAPVAYTVEETRVCPTSPPACPGDDGVGADGPPVYLGDGMEVDAALCADAGDRWAVWVPAGCTVLASATPADGTVELRLRDAFGRLLASASGDPANASHLAEADGDVFVAVTPTTPGTTTTYTAAVDLVCP
jgi:hypothetical protein